MRTIERFVNFWGNTPTITPKEVAERVSPSCVLIRQEAPIEQQSISLVEIFDALFSGGQLPIGPREYRGSGFIADGRHIITNDHVVSEGDDAVVHFLSHRGAFGLKKPKPIHAKVVERNSEFDIAVLKADKRLPFPPLKLEKSDAIRASQTVLAMKNPWVNNAYGSPSKIISRGEFPATSYLSALPDAILLETALVENGDSGSPVVNARREVIGIMSRRYGPNIGVAIPTKHIRAELKKAKGSK